MPNWCPDRWRPQRGPFGMRSLRWPYTWRFCMCRSAEVYSLVSTACLPDAGAVC